MDTTRTADERKRRLLLVEDDHAVSEALVDLLAMLEHHADAAASGAKALELFERHRYDLVLTDLLMPGMTGWEVLAAARGRGPAQTRGRADDQPPAGRARIRSMRSARRRAFRSSGMSTRLTLAA